MILMTWQNENLCTFLVTMEISLAVLKKLNRVTTGPSNSYPRYTPKRTENIFTEKSAYSI